MGCGSPASLGSVYSCSLRSSGRIFSIAVSMTLSQGKRKLEADEGFVIRTTDGFTSPPFQLHKSCLRLGILGRVTVRPVS